ncbi:hypothetical protein K437DRAFT_257838 [Tilletiaria anomala UBC 951]|uniref:HTH APSES-type domain-containing protein n=1 Tax=Tilletiaria anomala (strain ATCC 24038 / CBS 436.72 / UBC 951) TaxID=1037660 RepID=A0A066VUL3_TILAU|nr:uncharacterized protein K437DRAFT_257838 [Tilletiaria anomala UBC 951]KDN42499.1 hypothetical protein K437DRAFT_257838 [Tilletiaria anomala UBC 951]
MPRGRKSASSAAATPSGRARSNSVASNASVTSNRSRSNAAAARKSAASASTTTVAAAAADDASPDRDPPLPEERNPVLPDAHVPVKLQIIQRDASDAPNNVASSTPKEIIIGRVKLPTVNGATHGFLLKRFDTDAVAASAMFKLAFPYATLEAEEKEMSYLDKKFDCKSANGGTKTELVAVPQFSEDGKRKPGRARKELRTFLPEGSTGVVLMGTWVPAADAAKLAQEYGLERFAQPLIDARAAHFHGKPYFVDDKGVPIAQANGSPLEPAQLDALRHGLPLPPPSIKSTPAGPTTPHVSKVITGSVNGTAGATTTTPSGKRARVDSSIEVDPTTGSPRMSTTATDLIQHADGSRTVLTTKHNVELSGRTEAEIQEDIARSKAIAKQAQQDAAASASTSSGGRKRRAVAEPSTGVDPLVDQGEEGEDYTDDAASAGAARRGANVVRRTIRRGTRVARRRPIAASATALGVAGAAAAAATALLNPQSLDLAVQAVQAGVANLQGWLF